MIGRLLIHKCTIYRHEDGKRGNFTTKSPDKIVKEKVPCRFIRKTDKNTVENGRVKVLVTYSIMLPKKSDIKNGDRIRWSLEPDILYKVTEPYPSNGKFRHVMLEREGEA